MSGAPGTNSDVCMLHERFALSLARCGRAALSHSSPRSNRRRAFHGFLLSTHRPETPEAEKRRREYTVGKIVHALGTKLL